MKQGIRHDLTHILPDQDGLDDPRVAAAWRIWITIQKLDVVDCATGGHTDWPRSGISALDAVRPG